MSLFSALNLLKKTLHSVVFKKIPTILTQKFQHEKLTKVLHIKLNNSAKPFTQIS